VVAAALVFAAAIAGSLRIAAVDRPAAEAPPGSVIDAEATLLERPRQGLFGSSAPMKVDSGPARGLRILARNSERWPSLEPGTRFRLRGLVRSPAPGGASGGSAEPRAPADPKIPSEANAGEPGTPGFGPLPPLPQPGDSFDFAAFLRSRGIGREVRVESLQPIGHRGGLAGLVDAMRRRAQAGIDAGLSAERAALARGMVLGEDGDIPDATRDDFRRSGLAHLLAASGQNVALLCALALPLLMFAGATQRVRVAVLLPLIAIYVALAGSGASITRAGIMAAAGLLAIVAGRRSSAVYALLLAAAITLALNPRVSADPGWQLSFAAVGGMLALGPALARPLRRVPPFAAEAIGATVAATIATAPLLAHQFGAVSIAALPANLVAFPAVAPIMWIGMTEAAIEQVAGLGFPFDAVARAVEGIAAPVSVLALRWVAGVATRFADPAWAQSRVAMSWPAVIGAYAAIAGAAVVAAHPRLVRGPLGRIRRHIDEAWRGAGPATRAAAELLDWLRALSPSSRRAFAAPVVAITVAAAAHAAAPPSPPRHLTVDFIDVGQGDATLIRDPTGAAVLFDGGVPEARVDRTLKRLGVRKLSVVVATHQSRDHHGGLLQVVKRFRVGLFLDGRDGVPDASFDALEREVDRRRIPRRATRAGERLRVGRMTIRVLWPPPRAAGEPPPGNPNDRATVAIVSEGGFDLFLSADAESGPLLTLALPRVDAMKVPHHGSADRGLPQLLERLRPKVAAIETGRGNSYGHPTPPTLDALRGRVPRVYRSDRDGTTELTVDGDRIAIRTHR
jgi:competence protein ComEC